MTSRRYDIISFKFLKCFRVSVLLLFFLFLLLQSLFFLLFFFLLLFQSLFLLRSSTVYKTPAFL